MSTKGLLGGTVFDRAYGLFGVETDEALILRMCQIGLIYTVVVGLYSMLKPAPYGRYSATTGISSWIYGPPINAKLAWMLQEMPSVAVPAILLFQSKCVLLSSVPNLILTILFMTHYVQRSIIYPLRMTENAKPTPVVTLLMAAVFCLYNGLLQGHHLLNIHRVNDTSLFFIPGVVLFIIGMAINIHHDGILVALRQKGQKKSSDGSGKSDYQIPHGFLFEYVSGANYFGEILEWWGFAVASGGLPQLLFALFTTLFLGARAYHHHQFYRKNFGKSYPHSRKAVIPFMF